MKFLTIFCLMSILVSNYVWADKKKDKFKRLPKTEADFELVAINSPIKETFAKFALNLPDKMEVDSFKFRVIDLDKRNPSKKDFPTLSGNIVDGPHGKELHFKASTLMPGRYKLFVEVIDKQLKKRHVCKHKEKDHVNFEVDASLGVVDPGEKGKETLLGIDTNNNLVRDDVERWINENFNSNPSLKKYLLQIAVASQKKMLTKDNPEQFMLSIREGFRAVACMGYWSEKSGRMGTPLRDMEKIIYNTLDRMEIIALTQVAVKGKRMGEDAPENEETGCP